VVGTLYYYCVITQSGANCEVVSEVAEIVTNEHLNSPSSL